MKTALVCIAKMEELYIKEFIEHYKQLGITKIFIGDNNDIDYENQLEPIVKEYVDEGLVELTDIRGKFGQQAEFNNLIYRREKDNYDWFLFFDVDEFLDIKWNKSLTDFLSNKSYDKYNVIWINRREYISSDLLYYDDRPVQERFTEICKLGSNMIKSIVRGGIKNIYISIHGVGTETGINRCDVFGNKVIFTKPECNCNDMIDKFGNNYLNQCFFRVELKHYMTKTIEEYYKYKLLRGRGLKFDPNADYRNCFEHYFSYNKKTPERIEFTKKVEKEATDFIIKYKEKYTKWYNEQICN